MVIAQNENVAFAGRSDENLNLFKLQKFIRRCTVTSRTEQEWDSLSPRRKDAFNAEFFEKSDVIVQS